MLGIFLSPTISPTSGQKLPAALTTCSQIMLPFSVTNSHSSVGSCLILVTRLCLYISAPLLRAPFAIALVVLVGSVCPSSGVCNSPIIPSN